MKDGCDESDGGEDDRLDQLHNTIDKCERGVDNSGDDASYSAEEIFKSTHDEDILDRTE